MSDIGTDFDIHSSSHRLLDHSGWVHRILIQHTGTSEQPTVLIEFVGPTECNHWNMLLDAIREQSVDERLIDWFPTFQKADEQYADQVDYAVSDAGDASYVYHGWWTARDLEWVESMEPYWSFRAENLESGSAGPAVQTGMAWALGHPDNARSVEVMTVQLARSRAQLEIAESKAREARQTIEVCEAWFLTRLTDADA